MLQVALCKCCNGKLACCTCKVLINKRDTRSSQCLLATAGMPIGAWENFKVGEEQTEGSVAVYKHHVSRSIPAIES